MHENEKLREAIEWAREQEDKLHRGLVCSWAGPKVEGMLRHLANAAERTLTVPDDAEVREAVEWARKSASTNVAGQTVSNKLKILAASALSPRTRWYTVERDGPPTDTSRWLVCEWLSEHGDRLTVWDKWEDGTNWYSLIRYTYLDPSPVDEPLPKCWCGAEAVQTDHYDNGACMVRIACSDSADHGSTLGYKVHEARENWRKLRGKE